MTRAICARDLISERKLVEMMLSYSNDSHDTPCTRLIAVTLFYDYNDYIDGPSVTIAQYRRNDRLEFAERSRDRNEACLRIKGPSRGLPIREHR